MTYEENVQMIREEVKEEIAKSLIDTPAVPYIANKIGLDIKRVQELRKELEQNAPINKLKQNIKEEIAKSLVDSLAISFIATKVGVDIEKVTNFRQEYEQELNK